MAILDVPHITFNHPDRAIAPVVYLRNTEGGSDKWYVITPIDDNSAKGMQRVLVGYGPQGAKGNWRIEQRSIGEKKFREKLRKGYNHADVGDFEQIAINGMLEEFKHRCEIPGAGAATVQRVGSVDRGNIAWSMATPISKSPKVKAVPRDTSWAGDW